MHQVAFGMSLGQPPSSSSGGETLSQQEQQEPLRPPEGETLDDTSGSDVSGTTSSGEDGEPSSDGESSGSGETTGGAPTTGTADAEQPTKRPIAQRTQLKHECNRALSRRVRQEIEIKIMRPVNVTGGYTWPGKCPFLEHNDLYAKQEKHKVAFIDGL